MDNYFSPELKAILKNLFRSRREEILSGLTEVDEKYIELLQARTTAGTALRDKLVGDESARLFENYSDAIYAHEIYEHEAIYNQAFHDAVILIRELGLSDR